MKDKQSSKDIPSAPNRRGFLAGSTAAAAGAAVASFPARAKAQDSKFLRIGVVGCGGRGSGAAAQALKVGETVQLMAMADAFSHKIDGAHKNISKQAGDKVQVSDDMKFTGLEGYKKVIDACDLVILATPPGFRPMMFDYAVKAGKHVFMEKPVAVDSAGARKVLAAAEEADKKNVKVAVGLQRRYASGYREAHKQVHENGLIGDVTGAQVYWNGGGVWVRDREEGMTEMQYQVNNWYYFNWLCGDHIAEQHIHNLDVANWFVGEYPVSAQGMGGREVRTGNQFGQIYDHHAVEYTYPNGVVVNSQCRHIRGCHNQVREEIRGTKGRLTISGNGGDATIHDLKNEVIWKYRGKSDPNPYEQEHRELQAAVLNDTPLNNAYYGAKSSFTSVLGRYATYTGKKVNWDEALNADVDLMAKNLSFDAAPPVVPAEDGSYEVAIPGKAGYDGKNA